MTKGTPFVHQKSTARGVRLTEPRHPLVEGWLRHQAKARSTGRYSPGFNHLDYRQHRILSRIFFAVERHGVVPGSTGFPNFHFVYEGMVTRCALGPIEPNARRADAKLKFIILDFPRSDTDAAREWSDDIAPLDEQTAEIVDAVVAAARANGSALRRHARSLLGNELSRVTDRLKALEEPSRAKLPTKLDARAVELLIETAERHRSALLVRQFLRRLARKATDRSIVIVSSSLDEWLEWASAMADELDPVNQGAERLFEKIMRS